MRIEKGRIKYSYQPKNNNNAKLCLPPLPNIYYDETSQYKKMKLRHWYQKNYQHVDDITDILLEAFNSFLETRPVYHVQLDEQLFRQHMAYTLYKKSYSAYKHFP
jgi:hypothetical protein